ncbi:hypothetical protein PIB30_071820 [Stylosanthes scabra]|uniref:UBN2 domain-containing protein n=1 Tax=Stylosanthes scabra TaxID=79078 RepID=A0ABU6VQP7_9FABA|nr:hypothetical protein [Stylosanthes scabra]
MLISKQGARSQVSSLTTWSKDPLVNMGTHIGTNITNTEGDVVPKEEEECTEDDRKTFELNAKAINMMQCAITPEKFRKRVIVRKILRSLTKQWESKATTISKGNDLDKMTYDELRMKLLDYETLINNIKGKEKRDVAFKSKISKSDDESDGSSSDDELKFLAKNLRKLLKSRGKNKESSSSNEYEKEKMKVLMEYWKDLENESNSEDEDQQEAQVCFMADKEVHDESGQGYNAGSSANLETKFVKASASTSNAKNQQPPQFFHRRATRGNHCFKCNRQCHTSPQCFVVERKIGDRISKVVSDFNVLGQLRRTNIKGSKAVWIPKVSWVFCRFLTFSNDGKGKIIATVKIV